MAKKRSGSRRPAGGRVTPKGVRPPGVHPGGHDRGGAHVPTRPPVDEPAPARPFVVSAAPTRAGHHHGQR